MKLSDSNPGAHTWRCFMKRNANNCGVLHACDHVEHTYHSSCLWGWGWGQAGAQGVQAVWLCVMGQACVRRGDCVLSHVPPC